MLDASGQNAERQSEPDVLGAPFTQETISLGRDDEGVVEATLVMAPTHGPTHAAVLYVHGFCDYFFQAEHARWWTERGYTFYALDLRKYGRSLREHQTPNHITDLAEYFPELDEAHRLITERDGHEALVVTGHSTGGLTVSLWLHEHRLPVTGVVLNSPWLDMHGGWVMRNPATRLINGWSALRPDDFLPRSVSGVYGRSLHASHGGSWDFNTAWKSLDSFPIKTSWMSAIRRGHAVVHAGLDIHAPILVLSSARTTAPIEVNEDALSTDIVLDVTQIRRWSTSLGRRVTSIAVEGAVHDVHLSRPAVRDVVNDEMDRWLRTYVEE